MSLPSVAGAGDDGVAVTAPMGEANFVKGAGELGVPARLPGENVENGGASQLNTGDGAATTFTKGELADKGRRGRRQSRLDQMKSFLSSFNKQQDKTRKMLIEMKTPVRQRAVLSSVDENTTAKPHADNSATPAKGPNATAEGTTAKSVDASSKLGAVSSSKDATSRRSTFGTTSTNYLRQRHKHLSAGVATASPTKQAMKKNQTISDYLL